MLFFTKSIQVLLRQWHLAFVSLFLIVPTASANDKIHVAVASNFLPTLRVLQERFETKYHYDLVVSAGSTGKLYAQIKQGAPYDVFFAADQTRPRLLEEQGVAIGNSLFTYAIGQLAIYHPNVEPKDFTLEQLNANTARIAIANPYIAPYGVAARAWLQKQGQWQPLKKRIVRGENVGQAFLFVESGNAQMGLLALSNLVALNKTRYTLISSGVSDDIVQQAVRLTDHPGAKRLFEFFQSVEAKVLIAESGYALP